MVCRHQSLRAVGGLSHGCLRLLGEPPRGQVLPEEGLPRGVQPQVLAVEAAGLRRRARRCRGRGARRGGRRAGRPEEGPDAAARAEAKAEAARAATPAPARHARRWEERGHGARGHHGGGEQRRHAHAVLREGTRHA